MIIRVLESGRALEDLGGSRRVLNSAKGSRGVQKGPGGSWWVKTVRSERVREGS